MAKITDFGINHNKDKLVEVRRNPHLQNELDLISTIDQCVEYYRFLISNREFYSQGNLNNSYVLWIYDKADRPDFNKSLDYGRGHVSLPDIDIDVPGDKRDEVIAYLKYRYGAENVSQMITYGRLQGRSSLKEVLRMNKACGFNEMNAMTKPIPDEAAISDQLELMDEEDRSIIRWTLINDPESLRQWCHLDEEGNLKGDYAPYFDQAIRLEGTFKSQGKHAAGVVISREPLDKVCPMLPEKNGEMIAGLEMNDLEALGHVKFDILGLMLLDKLMEIQELIGEKKDECKETGP